MNLANDPNHLPGRLAIGKGNSLVTIQHLQDPSLGAHGPRQDYSLGDPVLRPKRRGGSSVLAWGKDHLPLKSILSKKRLDNDDPPDILEPWEAASRRSPGHSTHEQATEQPLSRIHLSRSNNRLKPCDCPSQGPLCTVPSVSTTTTGDDVDTAAQSTTLGSKNMGWASGLEKQAMTVISNPYLLSVNTFAAIPGSNSSQSNLYFKKGSGVDCRCPITASSLNETVITIQYPSTITTNDNRDPGTMKTIRRKPIASKPSDNGSVSTPPASLLCSPEQEKQNRIERLEKRRAYLARRRESIEKALHKLTWYSQPCSTLDFMKATQEVKKTTTRLHSDLADVRREEHDIGLHLFLVLKTQDEKNYCGGGSTSLWVSRVTR
ncbi:uncharacterized protein BDV17DRAFT_285521 [Aspergillus undulatus]|uniref:uncharacterized protein n=1 Tax=Aspergillus undulatus TaxID=1810928 RepID=UPI003CCD243E